jgi:hypothetical protein
VIDAVLMPKLEAAAPAAAAPAAEPAVATTTTTTAVAVEAPAAPPAAAPAAATAAAPAAGMEIEHSLRFTLLQGTSLRVIYRNTHRSLRATACTDACSQLAYMVYSSLLAQTQPAQLTLSDSTIFE